MVTDVYMQDLGNMYTDMQAYDLRPMYDVHVCMNACVDGCMDECMYACMHACMLS